MENRVVRLTESKAREIACKRTRPELLFGWPWPRVLPWAAFFPCGAFKPNSFQKTFAVFSDEPGLTVFTTKTVAAEQTQYPPSHEFSRGTDVSVFADVTRGHRGEKSAFIEFKENGNVERLEMLSTPTLGRFEFVASSLQEPFEYRVLTPTLESGWETLSPFDPPALVQAKWTVSPPAYLKMDPFEHFGFGYLRAPEGSILQLELEVEKNPQRVGATIHGLESNATLATQAPAVFVYSKELQSEWAGRLSLIDLDAPERGSVQYDEFVFAPIPDEPPLVEITEPAKDLQLPYSMPPCWSRFSLRMITVSPTPGSTLPHAGEKEEETLFVEPIEKEKKLSYTDLNDRALAVGDVITYMALAMDNKEPEGQLARSEIYFIEILPPEGNSTDGEGSGDGEQKEIPARDFINKTKKIIRMTYDAILEDELEQEKSALAIGSDALGLKHAMTKVYDENEGQFPIQDGIDLGELLNEATYHIEQTEIYAGDQMLEESLEPSEKTLRKLVQLYALMQKMQKQKSKGKGKPEKSEETAENQKQEDSEDEPKDPAEELKKLGKDLEKLEEFEQRQKELNSEIGRAAGSGKTGEPNQKIAKEQEELRRNLEALRDEWYENSGSLGEVGSLDAVEPEMKEAAGDLCEG